MPIQEQDQAATSSTSTEKETDMTRFRQTLTGAAVATALLASLSLPSFAQTTPREQPAAAKSARAAQAPAW
jgi:hypothetical protein